MLSLILALFVAVLSVGHAFSASSVETEQARVSLFPIASESDSTFYGLHFELEPGWKVYWREPGDTGYPPKIEWSASQNVSHVEILWPYPERFVEKISDDFISDSVGYKDEVVFPLKAVPVDSAFPVTLTIDLDYAICADICIPVQMQLSSSSLHSGVSVELREIFEQFLGRVPLALDESYNVLQVAKRGDAYLQASIISDVPFGSVDLFPEATKLFSFLQPDITFSEGRRKVEFMFPVVALQKEKTLLENPLAFTLVNESNAYEFIVPASDIVDLPYFENTKDYSVWVILLLAFIGGLILNVMPCVLPVLSIKLLSVLKHGGGDGVHVRQSFLLTALGVVCSFLLLAAIVVLIQLGGTQVGWGFHFQQPLFIITMIVVLVLFASNLWGFFEIALPGSIQHYFVAHGGKEGVLGSFLMGGFAALLATPCTAPFLGTAVGFALSQSAGYIFASFAAMGLGMALPYLVFSVFPQSVTLLPKPGKWMVTVKYIMGGLLVLTAVWLLWVLSNQLGQLAAVILSLLMLLKMFKLWVARHIAFFSHRYVRWPLVLLVVLLAFVVPVNIGQHGNNGTLYSDIWQEFSLAEIDDYVSDGKVVFVDVTADWCLTCKANKFFVLERDEVVETLRAEDIVAMRADWTNRNEAIAEYLQMHDRLGIPFNVVYGPGAPDGIVLSELLTVDSVLDAIKRARFFPVNDFAAIF